MIPTHDVETIAALATRYHDLGLSTPHNRGQTTHTHTRIQHTRMHDPQVCHPSATSTQAYGYIHHVVNQESVYAPITCIRSVSQRLQSVSQAQGPPHELLVLERLVCRRDEEGVVSRVDRIALLEHLWVEDEGERGRKEIDHGASGGRRRARRLKGAPCGDVAVHVGSAGNRRETRSPTRRRVTVTRTRRVRVRAERGDCV